MKENLLLLKGLLKLLKICRHMKANSEKVYFNVLNDIVGE